MTELSFEPTPVVLDWHEIYDLLEDHVKHAMDLPAISSSSIMCARFGIKKSVTTDEVRKSLEMAKEASELRGDLFFDTESNILILQEKEIKVATILVCAGIANAYMNMAKRLGKELNAENLGQVVEQDFIYTDLTLGSISIAFEITTWRSLVTRDVFDRLAETR